jgi:modification target Cys-rich repeat protein
MFDIRNKPVLPFLACGLLSGLVIAAPGCEDALGDLAKECGLVCPDAGIIEGNASISGVVSIDSFFSAVIEVRNAALVVSGTVRAELEGMAASLEIEGYASMSLDQLSAAVVAALQLKFEGTIDGGLTIKFQPPRCEASVDVAVSAAAECDVTADPGSIEAKCSGSCEVSAEVAADCQAMGTLECTGKAPNFECSGSCSGDCQLEVAAGCEGSCSGRCDGECSACTGGNCTTDGQGVVTNCTGSCSGGCEGTCKLEAAGSCSGRCEGSCTYDPGGASCEAGATAKCDVSAMAEASCQGKCEGKVEPPEVSAECKASVEAKANASVECTPPSLSVEFAFAAGVDADAQAEFKIWLEGFKGRFAGLLAASAKLEIVGDAAVGLVAAASGAVTGAAEAMLSGDANLKVTIGVGCALTELKAVNAALAEARGEITGSISATASITGAVSG